MREKTLHSTESQSSRSGARCRDLLVRLANSMGAALLIIDRDFNIVWVNEVFQSWCGRPGSFPGGTCHEILHERSGACQDCPATEAFRTGRAVITEGVRVFPDGQQRYLQLTITPITDDDGRVVQILQMLQDVTDRKRAEDELAQRLLYEKMVQEISSSFIASSDLNEDLRTGLEKLGTTLKADFACVLRFEPERKSVRLTHEWTTVKTVPGQNIAPRLHIGDAWSRVLITSSIVRCSDTSRATPPEYQALAAEGVSSVLAIRFLTGSAVRAFLCTGHHRDSREWKNEDVWIVETVAGLLGLLFQRRRREEQIVESQRRYKEILGTLREGVGLVDEDEKICFCNPALERIFETSQSNLLGKSILEFLDEEGKSRVLDETKRRIAGASSSYELPIMTGTGNRKHLLVNVSPLRDSFGKYSGAVGVVLDITDRKRAEDGLRQSAEQLRRANEMKDLFADILRHDLLDSVGVIKAYTETLLENEAAPVEEFLTIIRESTDKVVGILQDATQLARLEASSELEMRTIDLREMAQEIIDDFRDSASARGTSLLLDAQQEVLTTVSPVIREVFRNLISNAIKYGAEADRVVVAISQSEEGVRLSVRDSGEGVPEEHGTSIFARFKRASREAVKGTGLGLAIAKRIVELHGGKIWVEDNPEGGATFVVVLPVSLAARERAAA